MYGIAFPDGLRDNQKLPQPIITPTTKADHSGHDEPLTSDEVTSKGLLPAKQWAEVQKIALDLFARGQKIAAEHGLILVDTKYEFGFAEDGSIVLADEVHTPDSSRYWIAESYHRCFDEGKRPDSLDKDFIRSWVVARCDPYKDKVPEIPPDVVLDAAKAYIKAYELMTGQDFILPDSTVPILDRVRHNLRKYF